MRIVGGALSGRRFAGPKGDATRPTSERVREAVASSLESRGGFEGARVLDLYAGTGALAFEALSRGAAHAVLVDRDARVVRGIEDAAASLGLAARASVLRLDLGAASTIERVAARGPYDRVFVDAPYDDVDAVTALLDGLAAHAAFAAGALVVIEHRRRHAPALPPRFSVISERLYGDTAIQFLTLDEAAP